MNWTDVAQKAIEPPYVPPSRVETPDSDAVRRYFQMENQDHLPSRGLFKVRTSTLSYILVCGAQEQSVFLVLLLLLEQVLEA